MGNGEWFPRRFPRSNRHEQRGDLAARWPLLAGSGSRAVSDWRRSAKPGITKSAIVTLSFNTAHQTHKESLWRFLALVGVLVGYFAYMSWKFDAATGAWLALLSWSFFVLCTPVADGGFIVAFPVRLLFGTRMVVTQLVVWVVAIAVNVAVLHFAPEYYDDSPLTRLLFRILTTPWPYWSILAIAALGTAMSIWFGDEMMDVSSHAERSKQHKHGFKYRTLLVVGLGLLSMLAYYHLLGDLGVTIPTGS